MPFRHGKTGAFKIGTVGAPSTPTDVSTYCEEVGLPRKADTAETTTFGAGAKTYVVGYPDGTLSVKGKWDGTGATAIDTICSALLGNDTAIIFEHGPEGTTSGRVRYTGNCYLTDYQTTTPVNDVVSWSATFQITGVVTRNTWP